MSKLSILLICCSLLMSCDDIVPDSKPSQGWQFRAPSQSIQFPKHTDGCLEYQLSIDFAVPDRPFFMQLDATIVNQCDYTVHVPLSVHNGQVKTPPFVALFVDSVATQSIAMMCHRWVFHTNTQDLKPRPTDVSSPIQPNEQLKYSQQVGFQELILQSLEPLGIEYTPLHIMDIDSMLIHWPKGNNVAKFGRITERDACADLGLPVPTSAPWTPEQYSLQTINLIYFPESVLELFNQE